MQQITVWLSNGWNVVLVVLGLGLIVFLHELGHFLMAKRNKVRVEIFSLGFGQALWSFRRGETEYRIAWLPLGGYVKMAGETLTDERTGEPFELTSKTPWQRFQIFVAGAVMNLLIAFPIAILSYVIGKCEVPNEVGSPGVAEEKAGIEPGDVILEVGGRRIDSLEKLRIEMIRHPNGTKVPVKLRRTVEKDGKPVTEELVKEVTAMRSSAHESSPPTVSLAEPLEGSPLWNQGVREKDEITSVNGVNVYRHSEADDRLRKCVDRDVTLGIRRRGPTFEDDDKIRTITVHLPRKTWYEIPMDEGVIEARVSGVRDGSAASGVLIAGDVILEINGKPIGSWLNMKEIVEKSGGVPLQLTIRRDGETRNVAITPQTVDGKGQLGIERSDKKGNIFANVRPGSFYARMGLQSGDRLIKIDGHSGEVTLDGIPGTGPAIWGVREEKPRTIPITVERKEEQIPINLVLEPKEEGDLAAAGFQTFKVGWLKGALVSGGSMPFRRRPFFDAVKVGLAEPVDITVLTLDILKKVITGGESAKGFSGPIGIMQASYMFAERAFGNFLWLMCLITVNLGIFNLLPIPILDGGHNVLLLIEVVRKWFGKPPPSERFIAGFQYVGLAFILSLFVFVTYNDISRLIGHG